jgi:hypothetical protein
VYTFHHLANCSPLETDPPSQIIAVSTPPTNRRCSRHQESMVLIPNVGSQNQAQRDHVKIVVDLFVTLKPSCPNTHTEKQRTWDRVFVARSTSDLFIFPFVQLDIQTRWRPRIQSIFSILSNLNKMNECEKFRRIKVNFKNIKRYSIHQGCTRPIL